MSVPTAVMTELNRLLSGRATIERLGGMVNRSRPIMQGADPSAVLPPEELGPWNAAGDWTQGTIEAGMNAPFAQRSQFSAASQYGTPTGNGTGYQTGGRPMGDLGPNSGRVSGVELDRVQRPELYRALDALEGPVTPMKIEARGRTGGGDQMVKELYDYKNWHDSNQGAVKPTGHDFLAAANPGTQPLATRQGLVNADARQEKLSRRGMNPTLAHFVGMNEVGPSQIPNGGGAGGMGNADIMQALLVGPQQYPRLVAAQGRNAQQAWMRTPEGQKFALDYETARNGITPNGPAGVAGNAAGNRDPRIGAGVTGWLSGGARGPLLGTGIGDILQSEYDASSGFGGISDAAWRAKVIQQYGLPPDMVDAFIREYRPVKNARSVEVSPLPRSPGIWP